MQYELLQITNQEMSLNGIIIGGLFVQNPGY